MVVHIKEDIYYCLNYILNASFQYYNLYYFFHPGKPTKQQILSRDLKNRKVQLRYVRKAAHIEITLPS